MTKSPRHSGKRGPRLSKDDMVRLALAYEALDKAEKSGVKMTDYQAVKLACKKHSRGIYTGVNSKKRGEVIKRLCKALESNMKHYGSVWAVDTSAYTEEPEEGELTKKTFP